MWIVLVTKSIGVYSVTGSIGSLLQIVTVSNIGFSFILKIIGKSIVNIILHC